MFTTLKSNIWKEKERKEKKESQWQRKKGEGSSSTAIRMGGPLAGDSKPKHRLHRAGSSHHPAAWWVKEEVYKVESPLFQNSLVQKCFSQYLNPHSISRQFYTTFLLLLYFHSDLVHEARCGIFSLWHVGIQHVLNYGALRIFRVKMLHLCIQNISIKM